jgi:hypothetical protein
VQGATKQRGKKKPVSKNKEWRWMAHLEGALGIF